MFIICHKRIYKQNPIALTASHYFHQINDAIHVLARGHQALEQQVLELEPQMRFGTAHHVNELWRELERRLLEA